ncbi:MAG: nucleoside kinase [Bacilli bacterium]|nr:nucleoside kinase [Bacilli bacterium]
MTETIIIKFNDGTTKEYPKNISCLNIIEDKIGKNNYSVVAVKINNMLTRIDEPIKKSCDLTFLDRTTKDGHEVYIRGLKYIFIKAVKDVLGYNTNVVIEHSIDKGIYCEIEAALSEEIVSKIEKRMVDIVEEDLPFKRVMVNRHEAIEYFKKINRIDKSDALKYVIETNIILYQLGNLYDYFYGEMPLSTKYVDKFKLSYVSTEGVILRFPTIYSPNSIPEYTERKKIFDVFREYSGWSKIIGVNHAPDLNKKITEGNATEIIKISELAQNNKLNTIANEIYEKRDKIKIVLIAGPSSSGKTITSHKLSYYLKSKGLNPTPIGLDNYFVERVDNPRDEEGNYDYETIDAIDIKLFNDQLTKLLNNEEVVLPEYNFLTGEKEYKDNKLKLKENDILIIEGLHGLNEKLTSSISRDNKYKLYVSPLTVLNIDNHNRISTSFVRKIRRLVRDYKYRGYGAIETMEMWEKVREGEEKHVFPFQDEADAIFNTALSYELSILKIYAEPLLFSVTEDSVYFDEARRMIKFLKNFLPISADDIPDDSLIREFIGGSKIINN